MKRLFALAAVAGALTAAACSDPQPQEQADNMPPEPAVEASAAADTAVDAAATAPSPVDAAPPAPAPDSSTLPADKKSSEESVKPESETLFY